MGGSQFADVEGLVTETPAFTPFAFFFIWMTNYLGKCMRAKSALEFGAVYMYTCPTRAPYYRCGIIAAALEDLSVLYVLTPNLASSSVPTNV